MCPEAREGPGSLQCLCRVPCSLAQSRDLWICSSWQGGVMDSSNNVRASKG